MYLAECTQRLFETFLIGLKIEKAQRQQVTHKKFTEGKNEHYEYTERIRLAAERYFFSRNPQLVKNVRKSMEQYAKFVNLISVRIRRYRGGFY
jgi:hypothetical protein